MIESSQTTARKFPHVLVVLLLGAVLLSGCASQIDGEGGEGRRCRPDGTCNDGLECNTEDICVPVGVKDGGGSRDASVDAGRDAGFDSGVVDSGLDAGLSDAGHVGDAGVPTDSGHDAGADVPGDSGDDAGWDATHDGGADATPDASADSGFGSDSGDSGTDGGCVPECSGKCAGSDQCGGVCPDDCTTPNSCGGGEVTDECGCTYEGDKEFCLRLGKNCGLTEESDNCWVWRGVECGTCGPGYKCLLSNVCEPCGETGQQCCDGSNCSGDGVCNSGWCEVFCHDKTDFTTCKIAGAAYGYTICAAGTCVMPGCGSASCNSPGINFGLPDTGQRICYDGTAEVLCPSASGGAPCALDGTPKYCGQDAQYGWDTLHPASTRFSLLRTVPQNPMIHDNVTGLDWQGCTGGRSGEACELNAAQLMPWQDALGYCNALDWGGSGDWRLPDTEELLSLVDDGFYSPAIDGSNFPKTENDWYWSSSTYFGYAVQAWKVNFEDGSLGFSGKSDSVAVRCVRGAASAGKVSPRYERSNPVADEPMVLDQITGLVFQGCPGGSKGAKCDSGAAAGRSWADALKYCESLVWGGSGDFRLPSKKEMASILSTRRMDPAVDPAAFPGITAGWFWTSTSSSGYKDEAWSVSIADGRVGVHYKTYTSALVLCVRAGNM